MSNTIGLSIEIDANLKKEAELVMEQYGLNPTTAITMFYKQIARERSIPLSLSLSKLDVELGRAVAASQEERSEGFIGYPALQVADDMDAIIKDVEDGKDEYSTQFGSGHGDYTKERHDRLDDISLDEICGQIETGRK